MADVVWRRIYEDLQNRLRSGEFSGQFPTDAALTRHYGVSRGTVREAVTRLVDQGLVVRHRGQGSFVVRPQLRQPTGVIYSLQQAAERAGLEQRSVLREFKVTGDATAAERLHLEADAQTLMLKRDRYAGAELLAVDTAWLPHDLAQPLLDVDWSSTSLYRELRDVCGVEIVRADETIAALGPDHPHAEGLELDQGEGVLRVERVGWSEGRRVEFRRTSIRGSRFAFTSTGDASTDGDALQWSGTVRGG